jgi:uncharacterized protein (TIGR02099 family)
MERTRRRWWTRTITVLAAIVVFGALVSGLFQLAVMAFPSYRDDIADIVTEAAGRPVAIGGVSLGWYGITPELELSDITVYSKDGEIPALTADQLAVGVSWSRILRGELHPSRFHLDGLQLSAEVDTEGKLKLRGFDTAQKSKASWEDSLQHSDRFDQIGLSNCVLWLEDRRLSRDPVAIRLKSALLSRTRHGADLEGRFTMPASESADARFEAELDGDLSQQDSWNGDWSLSVSDFNGLPWPGRHLPKDLEIAVVDGRLKVQGSVRDGRFGDVSVAIGAGAVTAGRAGVAERIEDLHLESVLRRIPNGWGLDFNRIDVAGSEGPWQTGRAQLRIELGPHDPKRWPVTEFSAAFDFVRIQDVLRWVRLFRTSSTSRWPEARGDLRSVSLHWARPDPEAEPQYTATGRVEGLAMASARGNAVSGLDARFSATESGGEISELRGPAVLTLPEIFDQPIAFGSVSAQGSWQRGAEQWTVTVPTLSAQLAGGQASGRLELRFPKAFDRRPRIDLGLDFSAPDTLRFKAYKPRFWGEGLRSWLDRAIESGSVPEARLDLQGDLNDFPFRDRPGNFTLDLGIANSQLKFQPDWPALDQLNGHLVFHNQGFKAMGVGRFYGRPVDNAVVAIDDYRDAILTVAARTRGDGAEFYSALRETPLRQTLSGLLDTTQAKGKASLDLQLKIPLKEVAKTEARGDLHLEDGEFLVSALEEPFRKVQGDLSFGPEGIRAPALSGEFYGSPVTGWIEPLGDNRSLIEAVFDFVPHKDGSGLSRYVPEFLRPYLSGATRGQARLEVGKVEQQQVQIESDLRGVEIALPTPLFKPRDEAQPLQMTVVPRAQNAGLDVQMRMPGRLAGFFRHRGDLGLERGILALGAGTAVPEASDPGMSLTGTVSDADLRGWLDFLTDLQAPGASASGDAHAAVQAASRVASAAGPDPGAGAQAAGSQAVEHARLHFTSAHWDHRFVRDVTADYRPRGDGWDVQLDGSGAKGTLRWFDAPGGAGGDAAHARFEAVLDHLDADSQPLESTEAEAPDPPSEDELISPATMPLMSVQIAQAELGEAQLGKVQFVTEAIPGGQRIAVASARSDQIELTAEGQWRRQAGSSDAALNFSVVTHQIGGLIEGLGYARSVDARDADLSGQLHWAPSPSGLEWTRAEGSVEVHMKSGSLRSVEPGAGRMLGLVNFYALPRRITLNFSDVVSKGLGFDEVKGGFSIGEGSAHTEDLNIKGPSVRMEVRGGIGLADRSYNEHITVYPGVSGGVSLGALLLGGPALGALALVGQQILDKPLDQVTQFSYRVTGSWDNPQVERE